MGRWVGAAGLVAAALLLGGCAYDAELAAYCAETGGCQCADGDCCLVAGAPCDEGLPCCGTLVCNRDRRCTGGPRLVLDAGEGLLTAGTAAAARTVWVRNLGEGATGPLQVQAVSSSDRLVLDPAPCTGRVLTVGGACGMRLTVYPASPSTTHQVQLTVREPGGAVVTGVLSGRTGP